MYHIIFLLLLTSCNVSQRDAEISDQSLLKMADAAFENNDLQNAETLYQKILQKDPKNLEALYRTGVIAKRNGNKQQALMMFDMCLIEDPTFIKAHLEKAYIYVQEKKYEQAFVCYESALKIDQKTWSALNGKAMILDILGNHDQAQAIYNQIIQLNPSYIYAVNNLGLSYLLQGKWPDAIETFETLNRSASNPKYRQNLALGYGLNGDFEKFKALSSQDLPAEMVENNLQFVQNLKKIYLQQGMLKNSDLSLFPLPKNNLGEPLNDQNAVTLINSTSLYQGSTSPENSLKSDPSVQTNQSTNSTLQVQQNISENDNDDDNSNNILTANRTDNPAQQTPSSDSLNQVETNGSGNDQSGQSDQDDDAAVTPLPNTLTIENPTSVNMVALPSAPNASPPLSDLSPNVIQSSVVKLSPSSLSKTSSTENSGLQKGQTNSPVLQQSKSIRLTPAA